MKKIKFPIIVMVSMLLFSCDPVKESNSQEIMDNTLNEVAKIDTGKVPGIDILNSRYVGPSWELDYYVDNFGDPTDQIFIASPTFDDRQFSNSATLNSDLCGWLIYDKNGFRFGLHEYCRGPKELLDDIYTKFSIKDSKGKRLKLFTGSTSSTKMSYYGYLHGGLSFNKGSKTVITDLIQYLSDEPNYIKFYVKGGSKYSKSTYLFKISAVGFTKAYKEYMAK